MDAKRRRRTLRGAAHASAKLTPEQIFIIRQEPFIEGLELARRFGVSDSHISGIRKRRFWREV
jgi:DNA-binding transcriptional regulator YiaG